MGSTALAGRVAVVAAGLAAMALPAGLARAKSKVTHRPAQRAALTRRQ
jgi:hypothetical protein